MSVESVTQAICDLALRFGEDRKSESAMVHWNSENKNSAHPCVQSRPFGVALLIAGIDENGPALCVPTPYGFQ